MLVLGIESSCDDTAAAVVEDGRLMRSSIVSSQDAIHGDYGGIVPELASRRHIEMIIPVVEAALDDAGVTMDDVEGMAVTRGPGLVGSILVGLSFAKAVSRAAKKPLTGVNHIAAHPYAAFLQEGACPEFPFTALVVSGGHTTLLLMEDHVNYRILGRTLDDAAGEAFDKTSKLLGLGYPGGPIIDRLAREGDPEHFRLPRPYISRQSLDFSFSGLKTAVLNLVRKLERKEALDEQAVKDIAAGFEEAVVEVLVHKALLAAERTGTADFVLSGGVACNSRLRAKITYECERRRIRLFIPPARLCSDNGAVVAALGYHRIKRGLLATLDMNAVATWKGF